MKKDNFFKSTSFKCVVVLLSIVLVCGIFLTISYYFLKVSDQERMDRAIKKIYGEVVATQTIDVAENTQPTEYSLVKEAYLVTADGNYLVKVTGKDGYAGGTITCWIVVGIENNAVSGVEKVVIDSNTAQTLMSKINGSDLLNSFTDGNTQFSVNEGYLVSGATLSSRAINNAVNGAIVYVQTECLTEGK